MPHGARTTILIALLVLVIAATPGRAGAAARAALVMDARSGRVLSATNAAEPMYPASITKVVTALVVRELTRPRDMVEVDSSAVGVEGSSIYLQQGESLSVEDLLYGLLLESGNDAAHALAVHAAGDVASFAELMTGRVRQAGGTRSLFVNPHGLPDPDHVVTAADMGLAACELLQYPLLQQIVSTARYTIPWEGHDWPRTLYNHNRALGLDGIDGVKTGYTVAAGHTFVGSATRDGHQLVAVVMGATRNGKFLEARRLMNDAFGAYTWTTPALDGLPVSVGVVEGQAKEVGVAALELPPVPVRADGTEELTAQVELLPVVMAPVEAGQQLGEAVVSVNGETVYRVPLTALTGVPRAEDWWERWRRQAVRYLRWW